MGRYTEILEDDDDSPGVHRRSIATALLCWVSMNGGARSMAEAMLTFNTTADIIRQAIVDSCWLFENWTEDEIDPTQQMIEVDGE